MKSETLADPFPIRQVGDKWEVVMIDQGEVQGSPVCETREDAEAVANARILNLAFECDLECDIDQVRRSITAFERCGLTSAKMYRRLLHLEEDLRS